MGRVLERQEGAYLLCMGVLLLLLARGEAYTFFMNPRYRWLTLAAGGVLCGMGVLIAAHPRHEHHWSRMMVFAPFLALLVFVVGRAGGFTASTPRNEPVASSSAAAAPIVTPATAPDLAAGTAVGFLMTGSGTEDLDNGQWVRVTGRLEPMHDPFDCSALVRLPNTYVTAVHPKYLFVAEEITRIEEPEVPFSYELREREPYAY